MRLKWLGGQKSRRRAVGRVGSETTTRVATFTKRWKKGGECALLAQWCDESEGKEGKVKLSGEVF